MKEITQNGDSKEIGSCKAPYTGNKIEYLKDILNHLRVHKGRLDMLAWLKPLFPYGSPEGSVLVCKHTFYSVTACSSTNITIKLKRISFYTYHLLHT
jgi:hypothetical protein